MTVQVSIIMPSFNSSEFIGESMESVLAQTFKNWELIIVDDCSSDNSVSVIENYCQNDKRIRLITSKKNGGAGICRNTAIEASQGRYIAFLDSDDLWTPDKLEVQISAMQKSGAAFSFGQYDEITEEGERIKTHTVPPTTSYKDLLKTCVVGCLTAVYDAEKVGKIYMPLIRKRQDYGLWLKVLKSTDETIGIQQTIRI